MGQQISLLLKACAGCVGDGKAARGPSCPGNPAESAESAESPSPPSPPSPPQEPVVPTSEIGERHHTGALWSRDQEESNHLGLAFLVDIEHLETAESLMAKNFRRSQRAPELTTRFYTLEELREWDTEVPLKLREDFELEPLKILIEWGPTRRARPSGHPRSTAPSLRPSLFPSAD